MPYRIVKEKGGYRVHSPKSAKSKKPLTLRRAKQQLKAIYVHTGGK